MRQKVRCSWASKMDAEMETYHDTEWGVPVYDDQKLFEFLVLEGAQAGLSWKTILAKREGYRKAFKNFDPKRVANMTETDVEKLMRNTHIVRNRLKIKATINNAKAFLKTQKEYGNFSKYIWSLTEGKPIQNTWSTIKTIPTTTPLAEQISKDLKRRGFRFVGPTIIYAHMQATGMVNDHTIDCFRHNVIARLGKKSYFR